MIQFIVLKLCARRGSERGLERIHSGGGCERAKREEEHLQCVVAAWPHRSAKRISEGTEEAIAGPERTGGHAKGLEENEF